MYEIQDLITYDGTQRKRLDNGFLLIKACKVARTGLLQYPARMFTGRTGDAFNAGETVTIYRGADELLNATTVDSFTGSVVTLDHPAGNFVSARNSKHHSIGHISGSVEAQGEFLVADLLITDAATIAKVESNEYELSAGYLADYDFTAGTTPTGEKYHGRQRNIRGNHIACVKKGRCGNSCRVADSIDNEVQPMHVSISGVSYACEDANLALAITTALQKTADLEGKITADNADIAAKLAEKDQEIDTLKKANEAMKADVMTADQLDAAADIRASVVNTARSFDKDFDSKGMSTSAIKASILVSQCSDLATGDARLDDETYLGARYDALMAAVKSTDTPTGDSFMAGGAGTGTQTPNVADFETIRKDAAKRTAAAIEARRNKWNPDYKAGA
jgi:hypothetical protein